MCERRLVHSLHVIFGLGLHENHLTAPLRLCILSSTGEDARREEWTVTPDPNPEKKPADPEAPD